MSSTWRASAGVRCGGLDEVGVQGLLAQGGVWCELQILRCILNWLDLAEGGRQDNWAAGEVSLQGSRGRQAPPEEVVSLPGSGEIPIPDGGVGGLGLGQTWLLLWRVEVGRGFRQLRAETLNLKSLDGPGGSVGVP